MEATILCPECGSLANYNMYFGAYFCSKCKWEDRSPGQRRIAREAALGRFLMGEKMPSMELKDLLRTCEAV